MIVIRKINGYLRHKNNAQTNFFAQKTRHNVCDFFRFSCTHSTVGLYLPYCWRRIVVIRRNICILVKMLNVNENVCSTSKARRMNFSEIKWKYEWTDTEDRGEMPTKMSMLQSRLQWFQFYCYLLNIWKCICIWIDAVFCSLDLFIRILDIHFKISSKSF